MSSFSTCVYTFGGSEKFQTCGAESQIYSELVNGCIQSELGLRPLFAELDVALLVKKKLMENVKNSVF